ncbi:4594_t:CDS:1 [Ambispora gerdemannii]|uniref:4594_t:CDS:1 n=1 Tax=Ambispora gerdemannii TaxID=144530 RepID=A0A9N9G5G1_9GLOM|nr:4594_t:CDS:1 [Ambispora gerdemannii]
MNKQTSPMFILVALIFFAFVFSSSVNAMPKMNVKRAVCPQITYHCLFAPFGKPDHQVLGEIKFQQKTDCSVWLDGQINTVLYPDWYNYIPESINYDVHVVDDPNDQNKVFLDLDMYLKPRIDAPFTTIITSPTFDFTKLKGKTCIVAFEDLPMDQVRGYATIVEPPQ